MTNYIELIEKIEDAAEEWSKYVEVDTAPRTLPKHLAPFIDALKDALNKATEYDPLQGAVDWLLLADGEYFAVATVQRTLRIGYNRAQRLSDIAKERAAAKGGAL